MTLGPGMNPPGFGPTPDDKEVLVTTTGQVCAGYLYSFAFLNSSKITQATSAGGLGYATSVNTPGASNSPYGVIVGGAGGIAAGDLRCGRFCVALKDIPALGSGLVKVKGLVKAYATLTTPLASPGITNITVGNEMFVKVSNAFPPASASYGVLDATVANTLTLATSITLPRRYVGIALEAVACANASASNSLILVDFDGWDGMGTGNV